MDSILIWCMLIILLLYMSLQDMNVVIEFSLDQPSISLSLLEQSFVPTEHCGGR
jgi:hypothetical protein